MNSDSGIQPGGVGIEGAGEKYCVPTFNALSDSGVQWGAVGCSGMEMEKKRLRGKNNGYGLQGGIVDIDSSVKLPIWRENLTICLLYL